MPMNQSLATAISEGLSKGVKKEHPTFNNAQIKAEVFSKLDAIHKAQNDPKLNATDDKTGISYFILAVKATDDNVVKWLCKKLKENLFNKPNINHIDNSEKTAIYYAVGFRDFDDKKNLSESKEEKATLGSDENNFNSEQAVRERSRRIITLLMENGANCCTFIFIEKKIEENTEKKIEENNFRNHVFIEASKAGNFRFLKEHIKMLIDFNNNKEDSFTYSHMKAECVMQAAKDFILCFLPAAINGGEEIVNLWHADFVMKMKGQCLVASNSYYSGDHYAQKALFTDKDIESTKNLLPYISVFDKLLSNDLLTFFLMKSVTQNWDIHHLEMLIKTIQNRKHFNFNSVHQIFCKAAYSLSVEHIKLFLLNFKFLNYNLDLDKKLALPISIPKLYEAERNESDSQRIKFLLLAIDFINKMTFPYKKENIIPILTNVHVDDRMVLTEVIQQPAILKEIKNFLQEITKEEANGFNDINNIDNVQFHPPRYNEAVLSVGAEKLLEPNAPDFSLPPINPDSIHNNINSTNNVENGIPVDATLKIIAQNNDLKDFKNDRLDLDLDIYSSDNEEEKNTTASKSNENLPQDCVESQSEREQTKAKKSLILENNNLLPAESKNIPPIENSPADEANIQQIKLYQAPNVNFFQQSKPTIDIRTQCLNILSMKKDFWGNDRLAQEVERAAVLNLLEDLYGKSISHKANEIIPNGQQEEEIVRKFSSNS